MLPGFYVVRMPKRGSGSRLIVESTCFQALVDHPVLGARGYAKQNADSWCDYVRGRYPKDDVFVIEKTIEEDRT